MKMKKILAGLLALVVIGGAVPYNNYFMSENASITANAADEYTEGTYESLTYKKYSDYIEISGYDTSATEVVIPNEIEGLPVTSIGYDAFFNCTSLTSITIPDSVTSIGEGVFSRCTSLTEIIVSENNENYISKDGILFNKEMTKLIQYPVGKTETKYAIPESVTSIGNDAFWGCSNLTSVTIPDSVTSIGWWAFSSCSNLTSVTIPDSVTSIGGYAFSECSKLTSVTIPDSVTSIGDSAFSECSNLTSITIENPECEISDGEYTICNGYDEYGNAYFDGTIYGYENSTAQAYAEKYGYNFALIGEAPVIEPTTETTTETTTLEPTLKGDANEDGEIGIADAVAVAAFVANSDKNPLSEQGQANADVHNTGNGLNASDAFAIQQFATGIIKEL